MELKDRFVDASKKVFLVRFMIFGASAIILGAVLIICFAWAMSSSNFMKVKPNTTGQKIALTQDFLKEEYKEYVDTEEKTEMVCFYVVAVLTAACFVTPIVIFIVKKKRRTFRGWDLAYLIPIFCGSFILLLFAFVLSGSVKRVKAVGKPCTVEVTKVVNKDCEISHDSEGGDTKYYYVTFEDSKFHMPVTQKEYDTFQEGYDYYVAKCEGKSFRYYPVDQYKLE